MSKERPGGPAAGIDARDARIALVVSRFNPDLCERLLEGALGCLRSHGIAAGAAEVVRVPGSFELPLVAKNLAESGRFEAIICLGVLIRGETAHFDRVAAEAAHGIAGVGLATNVPVLFGVVTAENRGQAEARAGGALGNRGADTALAALEMVDVMRRLAG